MRHPLGLYYMALILLVGHIMCREAMKRAPPAAKEATTTDSYLFIFISINSLINYGNNTYHYYIIHQNWNLVFLCTSYIMIHNGYHKVVVH